MTKRAKFSKGDFEAYGQILSQVDGLVARGKDLAHITRAKIVCLTAIRPNMCLSDVSTLLEVDLILIFYHVRRLQESGFIELRKAGRYSLVSLTPLAQAHLPSRLSINFGSQEKF